MSSNQLKKDVIMKMTKPDLENVCYERNLPTNGTVQQLREQLLSEDFEDLEESGLTEQHPEIKEKDAKKSTADDGSTLHGSPQQMTEPQMAIGNSNDMSIFMKWMMIQEENRRREDERRRDEESRRREEEIRRREEEKRRREDENQRREEDKMRWASMLNAQQTLMSKLVPHLAQGSTSSTPVVPATDHQSLQRLLNRWADEAQALIDEIQIGVQNGQTKEKIENIAERLKAYDVKLNKLLDDNIQRLDNDEQTKGLVRQIRKMMTDINSVYTEGTEYVNKRKNAEMAKAREGPLPAGTDIPRFDGDVLNYRQWWDHFNSLVHENKSVAKFWKMRYLLNAMQGTATTVLAGKKGIEEEYDEAVELIQAKFGKEHSIVRQLVNSLVSSATPTKEAVSFGKFVDEVKCHLSALDSYNVSRDMVVLPLLENRLPSSMRMEWEKEVCSIVNAGNKPSTKDLIKYLEVEQEALCAHSLVKKEGEKKSDAKPVSKEKITSAQSLVTLETSDDKVKKQRKCITCDGNHTTADCEDFLNMSKEDRRKMAVEKRLCYRCLRSTFGPWHRCRIAECKECRTFHHMLVACPDQEKIVEAQSLSVITNEGNEVLPTVRARIKVGKKEIIVRLGLDTWSQKTFVTSSLVEKLGLKSIGKKSIAIQGFGGITTKTKTDIVLLDLLPIDKDEPPLTIDAYVKTGALCAPLNAVRVRKADYPHLKDLMLSDPVIPQGGEIDILVGQAPLQQIADGGFVRPPAGNERQPTAWKTRYGYALMGPLPGDSIDECTALCTAVQPEMSMDSTLENFWKLDTLGILDEEHTLSRDEKAAVDIFHNEAKYIDERYMVPLPFRQNAPPLQSNYSRVLSQMKSTERRLMQKPELKESYLKAMAEYEQKGFSREATADEVQEFENGPQYFIPHHAVLKESSVSTKCRVVFNASDPDPNGNSLNSCLLPGPALQPDLGGVLLRFRTHQIALTGDIEKMFMQTNVLSSYHRYQQYLWRDCDVTAKPRRMVMTRLMFGISSSPFCAIQSTHLHADNEEQQKRFPDICDHVKTSLYVDDWQSGGDNEEEVIEQYQNAVSFFSSGGWKLTKFASNSASVLRAIPQDDVHPHALVDLDERENDNPGSTPTALGLQWDTQSDCFHINVPKRLTEQSTCVTKRVVLSTFSAVYDIFGFLSAYLITVKILMQDIWRLKLQWDEELPQEIQHVFLKWKSELCNVTSLPIPRFLFKHRLNRRIDLHGFCDASEKAYGAIIYACYQDETGATRTTFVMSKTRVTPLKTQTIARLELMAALTLAKVIHYIIEQLTMVGANVDVGEVYLWSDSEIALAWIAKPSSTWKQFVRNRVEQIQHLAHNMTWNHCPGKENPADLISRGSTLNDLRQNEIYWHGPRWLLAAQREWPVKRAASADEDTDLDAEDYEKERSITVLATQTKEIETPPQFVQRSSKYLKTLRVCAWILRFVENCKGTKRAGELSADEINRAERKLLFDLQRRHFEPEIKAAGEGKQLPSNSCLLGFDPFVDEETGLLQVGGRMQHSNLPDMTRHPIILPAKDLLTRQIVDFLHVQGQHAAIETTLSLVRQKYHVIHAREVVRKVVRDCVVCRHHRSKPVTQKMGPLPPHRVIPAPAFTDVGLDFTGILHIKEGDSIRKGYICVFTCPSSRMIHLELTLDMTTEEFLQALRRFMNRRGWCRSIESDNQTSFKKAKKVLEMAFTGRLWERMNQDEIKAFMSTNGITWRFITERSPFRGAYWERLNRSIKEPLRKVLGNALLTYTEMYTLLTDIEATLNQRPLTYHGSDPADPAPITPSQLAIGRNLKEIPPVPSNCSNGVTIAARYRYLQRLLTHFWKRWSSDYLPNLHRRTKWQNEETPLKVGDVVLVTEENTTRPSWPLGRVIEVIPGRDNLIRTVKVKTKKGVLVRPVQRLHVLERSDVDDCIDTALDDSSNTTGTQDDDSNADEESGSDTMLITDQGGQDVTEQKSRFGRTIRSVDRFQAQ